MPEDGSKRASRRPRPPRPDAARWIFAMVMSAVVASAATSAVFLAARPSPAPPDPFAVELDRASTEWKALAPALEQFIAGQLSTGDLRSSTGVIGVRYTTSQENVQTVPMVSVDERILTQHATTAWHLDVTSTQTQRQFGKIIDVRRSTSLSRPGYVGEVELEVRQLVRTSRVSGTLPPEPPRGFQVVTQAKYTELEESNEYSHVIVEEVVEEPWEHQFDSWDPSQPPPDDLPAGAAAHFHEAIVQCTTSQPQETKASQTVHFFYSLRDRKWTAL